jgi:hypothetical protein
MLVALLGSLAAACAREQKPAPGYSLNPALLDLPMGRWVKVQQQRPDDALTFTRQRHGGSAFDSLRGRLVLFGSDTHARGDWTNSPLFFDLQRLEWRRLYPNDDPDTYAVTAEGLPVAGSEGNHPWAMHTFGAVVYDSRQDALVVSSYPGHLEPGRFTDAVAHLWPRIRRHPTWILDLNSGRWTALRGRAEHFFPFATAYDPHRGVVIGYKRSGVYELSATSRQWTKVAEDGMSGWGNNAVYDSRNRALVVFGGHESRSDVVVYEPATSRHRTMPTPGSRPPGANYVPMAYHSNIGRMVAVVDRAPEKGIRDRSKARAETWLYDLASDAWVRVEEASLPFGVGMNFNLEFDPGHRLLLLVAEPPGEAVAVWALRL